MTDSIESLIKKLNSCDEKAVTGYLRRMQRQLNLYSIIPLDINKLSLEYYHDEYLLMGPDEAKIQSKTHFRDTVVSEYLNGLATYGFLEISSLTNKIHEWKFKIIQNWEWSDGDRPKSEMPNPYELSPNCYPTTINIGIDESNVFYKRLGNPLYSKATNCYSYAGYFGHKQSSNSGGGKYGPWYITGDEVTMILDMPSSSISFKLNDKALGVAYDNLRKGKDIGYKMFIYIHAGAIVQLLSYKNYRKTGK